MSNIDNYLKKILSAVYGKDVRQAIHDSISECYKDVTNPSLQTGGFYDAVQEAIADGTLANMRIEDGSITQEKLSPDIKFGIEDGEVTVEKTNFMFIDGQELEVVGSGYLSYETKDLIPVVGLSALYAKVITRSTGTHVFVSYYDADGKRIKDFTMSDYLNNERVMNYTEPYDKRFVIPLDLSLGAVYVKLKFNNTPAGNMKFYLYKTEEGMMNGVESALTVSPNFETSIVKDGQITLSKTDFVKYSTPNLIDPTKIISGTYNASSVEYRDFGAGRAGRPDFIDVSEDKNLFVRVTAKNTAGNNFRVAAYDADKNWLYTYNMTSGKTLPFTDVRATSTLVSATATMDDGRTVSGCRVIKGTVPDDEVKFVRFEYAIGDIPSETIISHEDILKLFANSATYNVEVSSDWKNAIIKSVGGSVSGTGNSDPKTMIMIGDSLTNWGGGSDTEDGFLKIVHEKTGVLTTNRGLAGAWWDDGEGQTQSGVQRVDALIQAGIKYDLYCFMLGTNHGSSVDTGSTASDHNKDMCGGMRYCLDSIKRFDPTGQILVVLPTQRDEGNSSQEKVNEVIKKIADEYSVPTIDAFHDSGIVNRNLISITGQNWLGDGLHLGDNGKICLGNFLASAVKYHLCL